VVSAIQEYARRVRELRVQFGWSIITGITAKEMAAENEFPLENVDVSRMNPMTTCFSRKMKTGMQPTGGISPTKSENGKMR